MLTKLKKIINKIKINKKILSLKKPLKMVSDKYNLIQT